MAILLNLVKSIPCLYGRCNRDILLFLIQISSQFFLPYYVATVPIKMPKKIENKKSGNAELDIVKQK